MTISIDHLSLTSQIVLREFDFNTSEAIGYARTTALRCMNSNPQMSREYTAVGAELRNFKQQQEAATSPDLAPMTPDAMVEHLTQLGLAHTERSKVMETYRDAGQAEALEQAAGYLKTAALRLAGAKKAASHLVGITI